MKNYHFKKLDLTPQRPVEDFVDLIGTINLFSRANSSIDDFFPAQ
jgi:hypothetical protein